SLSFLLMKTVSLSIRTSVPLNPPTAPLQSTLNKYTERQSAVLFFCKTENIAQFDLGITVGFNPCRVYHGFSQHVCGQRFLLFQNAQFISEFNDLATQHFTCTFRILTVQHARAEDGQLIEMKFLHFLFKFAFHPRVKDF